MLCALSQAQFQQWSNKCLNTEYEPGSTFKPIVMAAALEEGVIDDESTFYCGGSTEIGGWTILLQPQRPRHPDYPPGSDELPATWP